jgi:hypothetical protein
MPLASERDRIAHLLRRAGFGAGPTELDDHLRLGFDGAVDRLVNFEQQPESPDTVAPEQAGCRSGGSRRCCIPIDRSRRR